MQKRWIHGLTSGFGFIEAGDVEGPLARNVRPV